MFSILLSKFSQNEFLNPKIGIYRKKIVDKNALHWDSMALSWCGKEAITLLKFLARGKLLKNFLSFKKCKHLGLKAWCLWALIIFLVGNLNCLSKKLCLIARQLFKLTTQLLRLTKCCSGLILRSYFLCFILYSLL